MTGTDDWRTVDTYNAARLIPDDPALEAALAANAAAGLPAINVSPAEGKLLYLLAKFGGARRILEIGTLGGYSTIWMARALPQGGRLISLEVDAGHAEVARANIANAGLGDKIEIRVGPALDSLAAMRGGGEGAFDLIFIDADKPNNPAYLEAALALSRPGTAIVCDNVVREGRVADESESNEAVEGIRAMLEMMRTEPRLEATAIQTVGEKGWDGFAIAVVREA